MALRLLFNSSNDNPQSVVNALTSASVRVTVAPGTTLGFTPATVASPIAVVGIQDIAQSQGPSNTAINPASLATDDMKAMLLEILQRLRSIS